MTEAFGWGFKLLAVVALVYLFWMMGAAGREQKKMATEERRRAETRKRIQDDMNLRLRNVLKDSGLPETVQINLVDPKKIREEYDIQS